MKELEILQARNQTRRAFCTQACQAATLVALGSVLPACGGSPTSPSGGTAPALHIGERNGQRRARQRDRQRPIAPRCTVGGAAIIRASGNNYLASRTGDGTQRSRC